MKRLDDKAAYIKEIQRFLMKAQKDGGIVFETGIYDEKTKAAVKRFKKENGMVEDTLVDRETYELLYAKYKDTDFEEHRTMQSSDRGDDVLELNMMLRSVAAQYFDIETPRLSDYYSTLTESGVRELKKRFRMPEGEGADPKFVKRLKAEYELTKNKSISEG